MLGTAELAVLLQGVRHLYDVWRDNRDRESLSGEEFRRFAEAVRSLLDAAEALARGIEERPAVDTTALITQGLVTTPVSKEAAREFLSTLPEARALMDEFSEKARPRKERKARRPRSGG